MRNGPGGASKPAHRVGRSPGQRRTAEKAAISLLPVFLRKPFFLCHWFHWTGLIGKSTILVPDVYAVDAPLSTFAARVSGALRNGLVALV
jgi:hypothetical protein